ncbi:hypothetical protein PMG11_04396 [Penicillium brasilianum]|uniref:HTH APSES-type domain-containing protein n=1 Tax=Penicillium brasilianum TaxID=104259 RepID=A0A0F7VFZ8_PENBI|nr:hypothetical protein PMG11_04396 [Penicillium brasilianum]
MPASRSATTSPPYTEHPPRTKVAKDGAIFRPGPVRGQVRYPPHEERTRFLEEEHRKADLKPYGNIADFPRHIPYQSDKKTFRERTGRDSFHLFQYTFQRKDVDPEPWTVTWDYNIGLVRTTHLFKCLGYSKTTPGKVLNNNNGLREISHSITGGALAAQGYWMPFEAAKAIAATFCWDIRFLLTPLFGLDFPELCIPPTNRISFRRMIIDPTIVNEAAETARRYRLLEPRSYDEMSTTSFHSQPTGKQIDYPSRDMRASQMQQSKFARRSYADSISSARGSSSEPYCGSPQSPTYGGFLPINRPPSSHPVSRTPYDFLNEASERRKRVMRTAAEASDSETEFSSTSRLDIRSKPIVPIRWGSERASADGDSEPDKSELTSSDDESLSEDEGDEEYREPRHPSSSGLARKAGLKKNPSRSAKTKKGDETARPGRFAKEVKAAHALLHMHMQRASSKDEDGDEIMEESTLGPLLGRTGAADKKKRRASL